MSVECKQFARCSRLKESSTVIRRLSDSDVRSIFESLHHSKPPPPNLPFSIVRVGPRGLKLSPPSFEFPGRLNVSMRACRSFRPAEKSTSHTESLFFSLLSFADGLYVLLRPAKKNNKKKQTALVDVPEPPHHLRHLLLEENLPEICPWSLSGPQFPKPTAIQQRYCYPKGRPEYSSRRGGALWTMYAADGEEDVEYRLLHVYFSAKRAINKGMSGGSNGGVAESLDIRSPPRKRPPRHRSSTPQRSSFPKRRQAVQQRHPSELCHSPAITTSSAASSLCNSPLSFDNLPRLMFPDAPPMNGSKLSNHSNGVFPTWPEQLIVTPINDIVDQQQEPH